MLEKQYISLRNVHTYHKPHQFKKEYTRKTQTAKKKKFVANTACTMMHMYP